MVGTEEHPGLMTLITQELYAKIDQNDYTVFISFLEIYNEIIRDLLVPQSPPLDLLENERGAVQVPGLSRVKAPNSNKESSFYLFGSKACLFRSCRFFNLATLEGLKNQRLPTKIPPEVMHSFKSPYIENLSSMANCF